MNNTEKIKDLKENLKRKSETIFKMEAEINRLKEEKEALVESLARAIAKNMALNNELDEFRCDLFDKKINYKELYFNSMSGSMSLYKEKSDLKQQLAEKDKEIERYYNFLCHIADLTKADVETLLFTGGKVITQNQTQLAIQELEKVKAELVNNVSPVLLSYTVYVQKVFEIINQRIKELNGGTNESE